MVDGDMYNDEAREKQHIKTLVRNIRNYPRSQILYLNMELTVPIIAYWGSLILLVIGAIVWTWCFVLIFTKLKTKMSVLLQSMLTVAVPDVLMIVNFLPRSLNNVILGRLDDSEPYCTSSAVITIWCCLVMMTMHVIQAARTAETIQHASKAGGNSNQTVMIQTLLLWTVAGMMCCFIAATGKIGNYRDLYCCIRADGYDPLLVLPVFFMICFNAILCGYFYNMAFRNIIDNFRGKLHKKPTSPVVVPTSNSNPALTQENSEKSMKIVVRPSTADKQKIPTTPLRGSFGNNPNAESKSNDLEAGQPPNKRMSTSDTAFTTADTGHHKALTLPPIPAQAQAPSQLPPLLSNNASNIHSIPKSPLRASIANGAASISKRLSMGSKSNSASIQLPPVVDRATSRPTAQAAQQERSMKIAKIFRRHAILSEVIFLCCWGPLAVHNLAEMIGTGSLVVGMLAELGVKCQVILDAVVLLKLLRKIVKNQERKKSKQPGSRQPKNEGLRTSLRKSLKNKYARGA